MEHILKIDFYDKFRCIADQCSFSCCKGWDISVDKDTYDKWMEDKNPDYFSKNVKVSKSKKSSTVSMKMKAHKHCPFLNDNELCNIVINYGEDYLSNTCRTFPRIVNYYGEGSEFSLSCACPAVVDILRNISGNMDYINDGSENFPTHHSLEYQLRNTMIGIMENYNFTFKDRVLLIFHLLNFVKEEQGIRKDIINSYQEVSYLKTLADLWCGLNIPKEASLQETLELFLDITQNYSKEANYREYLQDIYLKAEDEINPAHWNTFTESFRIYDEFLEKCIVTKIFANGISNEIDDLLMSFQLIVTEYIMIRFSAFLRSLIIAINDQDIRDYIVVYSRILGYNAEGMKEFWEESFDEAVWDLSYLLLLIN